MRGDVIDIGGKKDNKRGEFRPPLNQVSSWRYVNIDKSTNPDYCCSADNISVEDEAFDTALLNEVLEHLEKPEAVFNEIFRVLRKNGVLICSAPFLFPVHADPYDFQRWTEAKIRSILSSVGFSDIGVYSMGGTGSVIHDLLLISIYRIQDRYVRKGSLFLLFSIVPLFTLLDKIFRSAEGYITTGYFIVAKK